MQLAHDALSKRAELALKPAFSYMTAVMEAMGTKRYDPVTCPDGLIGLAVAENGLCFDMIKAKLNECRDIPQSVLSYTSAGYPMFIDECAKFMSRKFIFSHKVNSEHITISAGCSAVLENLFWALCDPGDAVIIPVPCYAAFAMDLTVRDHCHIVHTKVNPEYRLTRDQLEEAYQRGVKEAGNVRAVLLTNPNNPQGLVYSKSELEMVAEWANEKNIHIVSDEIYSNSIFNPSEEKAFISMADVADMKRGNVHIIWGFSKDFGLNGFRIGLLYSQNCKMNQAISSINATSMPSNDTQFALAKMLQDEQWVDSYLETNNATLLKSYTLLTDWLDKHGLPYHTAQGAQFCWMDIRNLLEENTWEGEIKLFEKMWLKGKVVISPGKDCNMDVPGYYRLCYASREYSALELALERLDDALF